MNDIFNSQEDPDTKIEPRSDKESLEAEIDADMGSVNTNEEEKESAGDEFELKRREKGKRIKETQDTPPPTPIRSPRTHIAPLSTDKEKHKELTISDSTPSSSTPSSSSSLKPNTRRSDDMLYQALKEMLPSMVNKEVNKIAKMTVLIYVAEGLLLERQKNEDEVAQLEGTGSSVGTVEGSAGARCSSSSSSSSSFSTSSSSLSSSDDSLS
ncbi:hypothetical protein Tco_1231061 [Tanacetum coccineum]